MAGDRCVICGKKRGKRFCREQKGLICSMCCAKMIYEQGGCPEDCVYWKSSRSYTEQKNIRVTATVPDSVQKTESELIAIMEMAIYDVLKKDVYYEDNDILRGTERKIEALKHPERGHDVLLNRIGVVESGLDEVIKRVKFEAVDRFSDSLIMDALRTYAIFIKKAGDVKSGGHKYIDELKERVSKFEEGLKKDRSKQKDASGYPLITLPFSQ
ncbi:hypothetical protein JXL19_03510 [bacterium]|nr:hypothetical protein [bacterium]